jgi:hypothetical protein
MGSAITKKQFAELAARVATLERSVVAVPSDAPAKPDNIYAGPAVLHDAKTGKLYSLDWSPTLEGTFKYEAAIEACKKLNLGGHTDWYLPERNELESLLDLTKYCPATSAPHTKKDGWYWSATPYAPSSGYAWFVNFGNGYVSDDLRFSSGFVRACRRVPSRQS